MPAIPNIITTANRTKRMVKTTSIVKFKNVYRNEREVCGNCCTTAEAEGQDI
jgi:hypothetical protein